MRSSEKLCADEFHFSSSYSAARRGNQRTEPQTASVGNRRRAPDYDERVVADAIQAARGEPLFGGQRKISTPAMTMVRPRVSR